MDIKRIIVTRTDKIGDLVLAIPSFFMLKKMYPESELIVIVNKYNYEIIKNLSYIDRIIKIDDFRKEELLEKISYFNADVFIALYTDSYIAQLARNSKAKIKIGPLSKLSSFFTYTRGVIQKRSKSIKNEYEYNLDLIRKLNKKKFDEEYELNTDILLNEDNKKVADIFLNENKLANKKLIVAPFNGGSGINLPIESYANIINKFKEKHEDIAVVIISHISEEEACLDLIKLIDKQVYMFANGGDILNLAALIDKADVFLGSSTGTTHIAGALNKKVVGIYSDKKTQHPTRWGVLNKENANYITLKEKKFDKNKAEEEVVGILNRMFEI